MIDAWFCCFLIILQICISEKREFIFPRFKLERFHFAELCFSRDSAAVRILIWYSIDTPTLNIEQASMVILRLLFFGFQFRANLANGKSGFLNMSMRPTIVVLLFLVRWYFCGNCICKLPKLETWISNLIY